MGILADRIKQKYPQYAGVPDAELESRVVQKYPQYAQHVQPAQTEQPEQAGFSPVNMIKNIPGSAARAVSGIGNAAVNIFNPDPAQNTLLNLGKIPYDAIGGLRELATDGKVSDSNAMKQVINIFKDRYGGIENIKKTVEQDPVGVAMDVASVLSGAGGAVKGAGALTKSTKLTSVGNKLNSFASAVDPLRAGGRLAGTVSGKLTPQIAKGLERASEAYATAGLGDPKKLKDIKGITGKSAGQLMREYELFDRSPLSATEAINQIDNIIGTKIQSAPNGQVLDILKSFDDKMRSLSGDAVLSEAARGELADLMRRKKEFVSYISGTTSTPLELSAQKIRNIKQAVSGDIPESKFMLDAAQTAKSNAAKTTYNIFKDKLNDLAGTKQLGKDESGVIKLKKVFENADARSQARGPVSLRDIAIGGASGTIGGVPGIIGGAIVSQALTSPQGVRSVSNAFQNASKIAEKGVVIPRPLKSMVESGYNASRLSSRVANPATTGVQSPVQMPLMPLSTSQQKSSPSQTYPPIIPSPTPAPQNIFRNITKAQWDAQTSQTPSLTAKQKELRKKLGLSF